MEKKGFEVFQAESVQKGVDSVKTRKLGFAVVDLRLGDGIAPVLEAHIAASPQRFRGIRHRAAWADRSVLPNLPADAPQHILLDSDFRKGYAHLRTYGLSFEGWLYHTHIADLTDLAKTFPDTTIIFNHLGGPIGVGKREEVAPSDDCRVRLLLRGGARRGRGPRGDRFLLGERRHLRQRDPHLGRSPPFVVPAAQCRKAVTPGSAKAAAAAAQAAQAAAKAPIPTRTGAVPRAGPRSRAVGGRGCRARRGRPRVRRRRDGGSGSTRRRAWR